MNKERYDAIIVLCGNIIKRADGHFAPTTYEDSDMFGMLGGTMRILAACDLYKHGLSSVFVFSTGRSQKTTAKYGTDVPTEASLYADNFKARLDSASVPTVILEDTSVNTVGNIIGTFAIIRQHGWHNIAVMTSAYHTARVQALCDMVRQKSPIDCLLTFLSAEDVVKEYELGVYDNQIAAAYASPAGQLRLKNEAQGLADIKSGKYVLSEFQLTHPV